MSVPVDAFLALPVMQDARVLAGRDAGEPRPATWITAIEWPVEDFVRDGEIVLTTGAGCDEAMLIQFVEEAIRAGAAAVCVSLNPGGTLTQIPARAIESAAAAGCPLVLLPWELRFAEVTRAFTNLVITTQYAGDGESADQLHLSFMNVLLGGGGLDVITQTLERITERPVLVLDPDCYPVATGSRAAKAIGEPGIESHAKAALALSADERAAARRLLTAHRPRPVEGVPQLGLGPGLAVCASIRQEVLAFIYALDGAGGNGLPSLDERAMEHAAVALAVELSRQRAIASTEARLQGDFFWELALDGAPNEQVTTKAMLLGFSIRQRYEVGLARAAGPADDAHHRLDQLAAQLRSTSEPGLVIARRGYEMLVLRPGEDRTLVELIARDVDEATRDNLINWGIAEDSYPLLELASAYESASRALGVGHALRGPGTVGDGFELAPYLMLGKLGDDEHAVRKARALLSPLLEYDEATARRLLETLEVFLDENGNASSAARRLHLNRHSLLYRLEKIEGMTGCSLAKSDDRFLLKLSLMLLRLDQDSK